MAVCDRRIVSLVSTLAARHAPRFWIVIAVGARHLGCWRRLALEAGRRRDRPDLRHDCLFYVEGVMKISLALAHRRALSGRWEWLVLSGVIDLIVAFVIITSLPSAFTWALGLLVGIDLVFGGGALIAMGLAARNAIVQPSVDPHPEKVAAARRPT
jgi:hypothetical protein